MNNSTLRLEQYDTVLFNANINPLGTPLSVKKAISESIDAIVKYPDIYYRNLKKAISSYVGAPEDNIVIGSGSTDLIRLFTALIMPKKALLIAPGYSEYEKVLTAYGCEPEFYYLNEEDNYAFNVVDFVSKLNSSYDMIFLQNPNNPTSQLMEKEDIEIIASACKELNIFLVIDEMYVEFLDDYEKYTSVFLTETYPDMVVLRSVSKFFAVPGLRMSYAIMNNPYQMQIINMTTTTNSVPTLTAVAGTVMFNDTQYIEESRSVIHTERSLVYAAMSTCKTIKLFKPYANFMLAKLLKEDITSGSVAEHCKLKGIIIRKCDDIRGLGDKYIRFCFMNPKQNDLMVNTILEVV